VPLTPVVEGNLQVPPGGFQVSVQVVAGAAGVGASIACAGGAMSPAVSATATLAVPKACPKE